nr:hypothetical protein [Candidatus Sigynarchaeota archaeon]
AIIVFSFFAGVYNQVFGTVKRDLKRSIIGAFVLGIGIGMSADLIVQTFGTFLIVTGLFTQLAGMALLGLSFYSIGSTDEFRWYSEVESIFLIFNSLCIYTYSIEQGKTLKEADLHGGGIATVLMVTQTIIDSEEPPDHIEYQNTSFLIKKTEKKYDGNHVVAVLIARKNLAILREKLGDFLSTFSKKFEKELVSWKGDTSMFKETCDELVATFHQQR